MTVPPRLWTQSCVESSAQTEVVSSHDPAVVSWQRAPPKLTGAKGQPCTTGTLPDTSVCELSDDRRS